MKIHFWGTAAAEGIPGVFCSCKVCKEAREKGGKFIRTRSQVMIDDDLLVDFGPDTYMHTLQYGYDLSRLRHVLVTHAHEDHFYAWELFNRQEGFSHDMAYETFEIYGSTGIQNAFYGYTMGAGQRLLDGGRVRFVPLTEYVPAQIGEYTVTPVPATHGTYKPLVYVIEKGGKTVFYLHDSGQFRVPVWAWLETCGKQFDAVLYDCTFAARDTRAWSAEAGHMSLPVILDVRDRLRRLGLYKPNTLDVLTHFTHNGYDVGYEDFVPIAKEQGFVVAYDGMILDV